eukprot:CAMPEP_0116870624 /NCGR_PEP_ID=MMETSP0463-20121206/607_1 /TAXON_ID=181622 /ORGANISM="Strombidinopsis sp, Strain SopsisLIS2011" /LENGTH=75 /DNA_ID=CAMNT_0004507497 /DNA_START=596 /DNA_END=823 /DNA_ORIENTATION=+
MKSDREEFFKRLDSDWFMNDTKADDNNLRDLNENQELMGADDYNTNIYGQGSIPVSPTLVHNQSENYQKSNQWLP